MKKLIPILLASLLLLAACGSDPAPASDDAANDAGTAEPLSETGTTGPDSASVCDLPDKNWGGREFRILGAGGSTYEQFDNFELYSEGETGEVVNDAIYRRNAAVEEKYGVKITQDLSSPDPHKILQANVVAGDDVHSLAFIHLRAVGTPAAAGCLYDLNKVNYIDFSKTYWNPDVNESVSLCNKLFFTTSDFSLRDKSRAYIWTYDADMVRDNNLPDLLPVIREGRWTVDTMYDYSKTVSHDLNGNGQVDDTDSFGLVMDSYNAFYLLFNSTGNMMLEKNRDDELIVGMGTERAYASIEKLLHLIGDRSVAAFCEDFKGNTSFDDYWAVSWYAFVEKRALFCSDFPHSLEWYSGGCDFEYTVIPSPKLDEAQEKYLTEADIYCMLFGIPSVTKDPDFSGFMLEALSAASTDTTLPAYYEVSCKTKYGANAASAEMLDVIFDGIVFDPGMIYSAGNLKKILNPQIPQERQNIYASALAATVPAAEEALKTLMEQIRAIS